MKLAGGDAGGDAAEPGAFADAFAPAEKMEGAALQEGLVDPDHLSDAVRGEVATR